MPHRHRHFAVLSLGGALLLTLALLASPAVAEQEVVGGVTIDIGVDPVAAKEAFKAAQKEMRDVVTELTRLQAEYRKDGSDKRVIEAQFNDTKVKGMTADQLLEGAAFSLAIADPSDQEAREHCGAVVAAAVESDDPLKAFDLVKKLDAAGAASPDVVLLGASAAIVASRLDDAEA